jgi:glycosyltransferase involved in cell wall biosynthesis
MQPTPDARSTPLVSIIVPSFNQGRFIKETLDSILGQDYRPIEVLVMDGASTDQTIDVLRGYEGIPEIKWWSEPDRGVVDAVNKGLSWIAGEIVSIQSSDDLYLPGAIRAAAEFLNGHGDVALVYGDVELIDENSDVTGRDILTPFDLRRYLGRFTYIPQPCAFFRARAAASVGGWRQEVSYAADADFWLRIAVRHKVVKLDRLLARYRYHPDQRDTQRAQIARDWEKAVRDLLAANALDRSTRRFARMGVQLAKHRYTDESKWFRKSLFLYCAAVANPRAVFSPAFPKREFIIGREPVWKFLSRVKRRLGFRPRTPIAS